MNISRQCAHKWWGRYQAGPGWARGSLQPSHTCPHRTPARLERRIVALRQSRKLGPARLAGIVEVPASTIHRVLVRHGVNRLRWMDRPTGRVIRRIETNRCGELVHVDVKKLARVPAGGGHRFHGRTGTRNGSMSKRGLGYTHIHTAIDAYSRLAYSEFGGTENAANGKVERFNRTLADEWSYARLWRSEVSRARGLDRFLHRYNHHRHHAAIGGPPTSRVNNLAGHNT